MRSMELPTKRHVYPEQYGVMVTHDEAGDPRSLKLIVWRGDDLEQVHLPLSEDMRTHLHDATGPRLDVMDATALTQLPDPPDATG